MCLLNNKRTMICVIWSKSISLNISTWPINMVDRRPDPPICYYCQPLLRSSPRIPRTSHERDYHAGRLSASFYNAVFFFYNNRVNLTLNFSSHLFVNRLSTKLLKAHAFSTHETTARLFFFLFALHTLFLPQAWKH